MKQLHPQCRAVLDAIEAAMPAIDWRSIGAEEVRALYSGPSVFAPGDEVESITERSIPGPGGPLRLRLYRPRGAAGPLPMTVYLHGGGFCFGAPEGHDNLCRSLAQRASTLVVSVDYRLAPEAPFPAAVDDSVAALGWVRDHAMELGGDASRIAVAGDSAGGALATVVARLARDEAPRLRHQLLIYPVTDSGCDFPSYTELGEGYLLTTEMMRWFWRQYLAQPADAANPQACPLRQRDLAGLAPATIVIPGFDPACDEGRAYAAALRDAGVAVTVHEWPDQIHGFANMPGAIDAAEDVLDQAADALRRAFA